MLQLHMIPTSGDATLLRFVENGVDVNILIDGGNRKDDCADYLKSQGVETVHLAVASHLDEDHIRGLRKVTEKVPVEEALDNRRICTGSPCRTVLVHGEVSFLRGQARSRWLQY